MHRDTQRDPSHDLILWGPRPIQRYKSVKDISSQSEALTRSRSYTLGCHVRWCFRHLMRAAPSSISMSVSFPFITDCEGLKIMRWPLTEDWQFETHCLPEDGCCMPGPSAQTATVLEIWMVTEGDIEWRERERECQLTRSHTMHYTQGSKKSITKCLYFRVHIYVGPYKVTKYRTKAVRSVVRVG